MSFIKKSVPSIETIPTPKPTLDIGMRESRWEPERESVIAGDTRFEGNITTQQPLQIYGTVTGDIISESQVECSGGTVVGDIRSVSLRVVDAASITGDLKIDESLLVDENTTIRGNIAAGDVTVNGKIIGNLKVESKVTLGSNGVVEGDICTGELEVLAGGRVNGRIEIPVVEEPVKKSKSNSGFNWAKEMTDICEEVDSLE